MEANETQTKHTPGPWTYRKAATHFHIEADAKGFGKAIAEVKFCSNLGWTTETNARLIAAAPELLAALQDLANGAGAMRVKSDLVWELKAKELTDAALIKANAAIAKAEGE